MSQVGSAQVRTDEFGEPEVDMSQIQFGQVGAGKVDALKPQLRDDGSGHERLHDVAPMERRISRGIYIRVDGLFQGLHDRGQSEETRFFQYADGIDGFVLGATR